MEIYVGSKNETKVGAVLDAFPQARVLGRDVPSHVSAQPFGDEKTLEGAINRAKEAQALGPDSFGIGLEGGVIVTKGNLYVCNWGALVTPTGRLFTASGARVRLPDDFIAPLQSGVELSELMNAYTKRKDIRHKEGAVGIFTAGVLGRKEMFRQVVDLLKGQYLYAVNQK